MEQQSTSGSLLVEQSYRVAAEMLLTLEQLQTYSIYTTSSSLGLQQNAV